MEVVKRLSSMRCLLFSSQPTNDFTTNPQAQKSRKSVMRIRTSGDILERHFPKSKKNLKQNNCAPRETTHIQFFWHASKIQLLNIRLVLFKSDGIVMEVCKKYLLFLHTH